MPQNWKTYKLGEVANIGSSKRIFRADYVPFGIPFYRSKEIIQKSFGEEVNDVLYIDPDKYYRIKEKYGSPVQGDVLLSAVGNRSGIPYLVDNDGDFYFKDGNLMLLRDFKVLIDSSFLVYWFKSKVGQHYLNSLMIGSAQKALTIEGVKTISIILPPLPEQKAIANILSAIDAKIENNLAINKTLEEMAMALYKEWFVDFGPFQDGKFIESELGLIPEGWEVRRLDEVASFKNGKGISVKERDDAGKYKIYGSNGIIGRTNKLMFKDSVIAIGRVGANYGEVHYSVDPCWVSDNAVTAQPLGSYYWWLLQTLRLIDYSNFVGGSAQPLITQTAIKNHLIPAPETELILDISNKMGRLFESIQHNNTENQSLTQLRDSLLPKLISGEVRLNEFDLEEVLENEI